jgi:hypothetical protein
MQTEPSRLTSGTETRIASDAQFAERLDRIKCRNGNDQPHPDAGNPYEQISAGQLLDTDVFASGLAVRNVEIDGLIVSVDLSDGSSYRYGDNNPVLIKRRTTEHVEARELRDGDVIVDNQTRETIPVLLATPYGSLIMIWTDTTRGFVLSPTVTVNIKRRKVGA